MRIWFRAALLNAKGANVAHRLEEPIPVSQRLDSEEQIRHIFVFRHVKTALNPLKPCRPGTAPISRAPRAQALADAGQTNQCEYVHNPRCQALKVKNLKKLPGLAPAGGGLATAQQCFERGADRRIGLYRLGKSKFNVCTPLLYKRHWRTLSARSALRRQPTCMKKESRATWPWRKSEDC